MNGRVVALADYRGTPRLRSAVEAFFSDTQLSANTRRGVSGRRSRPWSRTLAWTFALTNWTPAMSWRSSSNGGWREPVYLSV